MLLIKSFIFCGLISLIGQIILENTKLTPAHVTSLFVILGASLDTFSIYDKLVNYFGGGACVPITSFGHLLIHGGLEQTKTSGVLGIFMGMFNLTASGISAAIIFAFFMTLIFKPKN